jgi:hypothetical protein
MLQLFLAALAGAVGALVLRTLLKVVSNYASSVRPLATYECAEIGSEQDPMKLWHAFGERVVDDKADRGVAWAHNPTKIGKGDHTVFGPYTNDLGRPGYLRATFRMSGAGFGKGDEPVVVLDVVQVPYDLQDARVILKQHVVRARDLRPTYRTFEIICYTSGVGVHEYRARVIEKAFNTRLHRVHLDNVRVYRHFPFWELI